MASCPRCSLFLSLIHICTELTRLVKKTATSYIYIGKPVNGIGEVEADTTSIQLNDKIVQLADIKSYLVKERKSMSDVDKRQMNVSIRCDKGTPMGVMIDIKQALREINAVSYTHLDVYKRQVSNKKTYMLITAFNQANDKQRAELESWIGKTD